MLGFRPRKISAGIEDSGVFHILFDDLFYDTAAKALAKALANALMTVLTRVLAQALARALARVLARAFARVLARALANFKQQQFSSSQVQDVTALCPVAENRICQVIVFCLFSGQEQVGEGLQEEAKPPHKPTF